MSVQSPPLLQKQAIQTLVRNEVLAMSSLEELPTVFFPALFKEAFTGRQTKLIKAMVAAWPFPCLPVGSLMKKSNMETLQAVLDGVDIRLKRKFYPRSTKLQMLDMRYVHCEYWNIWDDADDSDCSSETLDEKQVEKVLPRHAVSRRLNVIVDLNFTSHQSESKAFFLNWVQQRKRAIHFCCTKMKIWPLPFHVIREILNVFDPEHIIQLELTVDWTLLELTHFAPYFGQMKNLHKLYLAPLHKDIYPITNITSVTKVKCINKIISQFSKFNCLQHIYMKRVHFLRDKMNQVLGFLNMPLETLSITHCLISQRDLDSFSCCHSLFQLKHLEIIGVTLYDLDLMHLRGLLEKVVDTLETLDLSWCKMKNSQLNVLLPTLSQFTQLNKINFYNNNFSMPILKDFLQHTANWSKMNVEQYPAPLECYDELNHVSRERFAQLCRELMDTLRAIRQPKSICFATDICPTCCDNCVYGQGAKLCACWQ